MKMTQEIYNLILDIRDKQTQDHETIKKMAKIINSQELQIKLVKDKLHSENPFRGF